MASPSEGNVIGFNVNMMLDMKADAETPEMLKKWRYMKELHDRFFEESYPLQLFRGVTNPFVILSIGPFADLQEHVEDFAQSSEMDDFLNTFSHDIKIVGAFHLEKRWREMPTETDHISLIRYFIRRDQADEFQQAFDAFLRPFITQRKDKLKHLAGWRIPGGWYDPLPSDDALELGGVNRPGFSLMPLLESGAGVEAADDDGSDEDTREFVIVFAWSDLQAMDDFQAELDTPFRSRDASWQSQNRVVAASRVCCVRNFRRISLEE